MTLQDLLVKFNTGKENSVWAVIGTAAHLPAALTVAST